MSSVPPTPADLLRVARAGDVEARGALFEYYRNYLELLARMEIGKRLQTKLDTADLLQEVFLEAHRGLPSFRGEVEAEFVAWLRSILSAKLSNLLRHYTTQGRDMRRERGMQVDLDQSSQMLERAFHSPLSSPSQHVMRIERGVSIADAVARLPADYRDVIIMRHLEELPFPEIAVRMDRSPDSVQKLWVRGLTALRQIIRNESGA